MNALTMIVTDGASAADQNWVAAAWFIYGGVAFILLISGLADYFNSGGFSDKMSGARKALAAPVWPVVLIVVLVVGLIQFVGDLWKAAYIK